MKLYLAGPDVFHADAATIGARKKALCARYGFEGLFPLDAELGDVQGLDNATLAARIYDNCIAMMDRAEAMLANITPYQGAGADDGTAFELGYAVAKGLPVALYDNGCGDTAEKSAAFRNAAPTLVDPAIIAEDFGLPVNLMLAVPALRRAPIATGETALPLTDLSRFETALAVLLDSV